MSRENSKAQQESQIICIFVSMPAGRPRKFDAPEQVWDVFQEYIHKCESRVVEKLANNGKVVQLKEPRIPHIGEFCIHANITRELLNRYGKEEGFSEFHDTIKMIKDIVASTKWSSLINAEGSTSGLIFDLKVNDGAKDVQHTEFSGDGLTVNIVKRKMDEDDES